MAKKIKKKDIIYQEEENSEAERKLKKLKKELKHCQEQKQEYLFQAQKNRADFLNYQKKQEERLEEFKKYRESSIINDILPFLDSLEQGAKNNKEINFLKKQLQDILKKHGLKKIKTRGEKFDPNYHEAIKQIASSEKSGVIIKEYQKGYLLHDKLLRPSRVKVAE